MINRATQLIERYEVEARRFDRQMASGLWAALGEPFSIIMSNLGPGAPKGIGDVIEIASSKEGSIKPKS